MASKESLLKKKMIKEGIIALVVLTLLGAGSYFLSNSDDEAIAEKQAKQNDSTTMQGEQTAIQQRLGSGLEVSEFYAAYIRHHNTDLVPQRDIATQWMAALRESNHLTNLSIAISPITEISLEPLQFHSGKPIKSEVQFTFGAITDNSLYGFLENLEQKMPGIMIIEDIKLTHPSSISRDVLVGLSQHVITPLVIGDVSFIWLGIRPTEAAPPANGAGNAAR